MICIFLCDAEISFVTSLTSSSPKPCHVWKVKKIGYGHSQMTDSVSMHSTGLVSAEVGEDQSEELMVVTPALSR